MSSRVLKEFGRVLMGPLLTFICQSINNNTTSAKPFFLAREGYWLSRAYRIYTGDTQQGEVNAPNYLLASRAFMFRLMVDDPRSYDYSLKGAFSGRLYELMRSRFMLSDRAIKQTFTEDEYNECFDLPKDQKQVRKVLTSKQDVLTEAIEPTKAAYLAYLRSLGVFDVDEIHLVDLGYSGTIQKLLTLLLEKNTVGHYLIASMPGTHVVNGYNTTMKGYLMEGRKLGDGYIPLDRSMFLEALLTSPDGQFQDIRLSDHPEQDFELYYGRKVITQKCFHEVEQVMKGALEYVAHAARHNIRFTTDEIENLLGQHMTRQHMIPAVLHPLFAIDDDVAGNGTVDALQFFGLK